MNPTVLTKMEANLLRLEWVFMRLFSIYKKFPNLTNEDEWNVIFGSTMRENIIIQLHNFIKIRKDLIDNPKILAVDKQLEPLWKPILDLQKPIELLRHNYIAHIQEGNRLFRQPASEIVNKFRVPTKLGNWLFLAACASFYTQFIKVNFISEWNSAHKKNSSFQKEGQYGNIKKDDVRKYFAPLLKQAITNLKQNNLKSEFV